MSAIITHISQEMKKGAAEFAKAAIAKIPVRTGFAAGSINNLAKLLGEQAKLNPIIGFSRSVVNKVGSEKGTSANKLTEYYYPPGGGKVLKTTTSGAQFATSPENIIRRRDNILIFQYEVDISYFNFQDINRGRSPTSPWGAFEAGEAAFLQYMEDIGLRGIPNIWDFVNESFRTI